jgi:hypothetical protein
VEVVAAVVVVAETAAAAAAVAVAAEAVTSRRDCWQRLLSYPFIESGHSHALQPVAAQVLCPEVRLDHCDYTGDRINRD